MGSFSIIIFCPAGLLLFYKKHAIALAALAAFGFYQANVATKRATISRSQVLAANSQLNRDKVTTSLLLSIESLKLVRDFPYRDRVVAEQALRDSLTLAREGFDLSGHKDWIWNLAFSPDGHWLATRSEAVQLWDLNNPTAEPLLLPQDGIGPVAFSPESQWLAGGSGNQVVLWDMNNPFNPPTFLQHDADETVLGISFSKDGKWLVSELYTIYLWDLNDLSAEPIHLENDWGAVLSPDGQRLATISYDGYAQIWNLNDLSAQTTILQEQDEEVSAISFSPDGKWLATGNNDNMIRLWDLSNASAEPLAVAGHQVSISRLTFSPDGKWLVTSDHSETRLWTVEDLSAESLLLNRNGENIETFAFSPDSQWLAIGGDAETVQMWDMNKPFAEPSLLHGHTKNIAVLAFSSDGKWLATGSADGTARLWVMKDPATEPTVLHNYDDVTRIAISPDGKWLAAGTDQTVRLWDMEKISTEPILLRGYEGGVWSLSFSPDGRWLAVGDSHPFEDLNVAVWDLKSPGSVPIVLPDAESPVFSPDSKWLATESCNNRAEDNSCAKAELDLWDLDNPSTRPTWTKSQELFGAITFSPDGKLLAIESCKNRGKDSYCVEAEIDLWDLSVLSHNSCENLSHNFCENHHR